MIRLCRLIRFCCVFFCVSLLLTRASRAQTFFSAESENALATRLFDANGISFGDYDNDGWPDMVLSENSRIFVDGGDWIALLHNNGNGRFEDRTATLGTDLSEAEGARSITGHTQGSAVFGDYDNDGDVDLYVPLGVGYSRKRGLNALLRNDRGRFDNVTTEANLKDELSSNAAIWLDYNRDGYLDLYVGDQSIEIVDLGIAQGFRISSNRTQETYYKLYRNNRDGTFTDATHEALINVSLEHAGTAVGNMVAGDFNDDGWPDLYLGIWGGPNRLFFNGDPGEFQDATTGEIDDPGQANGVAVGDIDNDGDLDIVQVAGSLGLLGLKFRSLLLQNLGAGQFLDVTEGLGLADLGSRRTQGVILADIDNDGDLDLLTAQEHFLYLNDGSGTFVERTSSSGIENVGVSLAAVDYNLDGFIDMVFGSQAFPPYNRFGGLYRNNGNDNHYLRVELAGAQSNRDGVGARLLATAGDLRQMREILGGTGSYQHEPIAHFGLGPRSQVDRLEIRWPSGRVDVLHDIPADQKIRVFEGRDDYHRVVPTVWEHNLPDTAVVGSTFQLSLTVHPALFEAQAIITRCTADLSGLGGPSQVPLSARGDGRYRLEETSLTLDVPPGPQSATVQIDQETSQGIYWTQLEHVIRLVAGEFPTEDLSIYTDGSENNWQVREQIESWNANTLGIDVLQDTGIALDLQADSTAYEGESSLAVQVEPVAPREVGDLVVWDIAFLPPKPVVGYGALRFAFHPASPNDPVFPALHIFVNDKHVTSMTRFPFLVSLIPGMTADHLFGVNTSLREWQEVEIPLDIFGLDEAITSVSFKGTSTGTFYMDDIRLVPATAPSNTAVLVDRQSTPLQSFSLAQNYPNPFNNSTLIRFALPQRAAVELVVYNLAGQKVATLIEGMQDAGLYTIHWDGRDESGLELASGVYLYRLEAGAGQVERKLVLVR